MSRSIADSTPRSVSGAPDRYLPPPSRRKAPCPPRIPTEEMQSSVEPLARITGMRLRSARDVATISEDRRRQSDPIRSGSRELPVVVAVLAVRVVEVPGDDEIDVIAVRHC